MEKRYKALRIIGTLYKIFGTIVGVITVLVILSICATSVLGGAGLRRFGHDMGLPAVFSGMLGGLILSVVAIIYGGGLAITLYAAGEAVYLLLALEENTRATAMLLQRRANPPAPDS